MASNMRKNWQEFKKNHPAFEQHKNFKSDVGPQLDKFDKARDEFAALKEQIRRKAAEVVTLGNSVSAALKGYQAVVKQLQEEDKTIRKDFNDLNFDDFAGSYVDHYEKFKDF